MIQSTSHPPRFYLKKANQLKNQGQINEALEQYKLALKIDANFIPAHVRLAEIYESKQQFEQSIIHREKVVKLRPKNAIRLAELAKVKQKLEDISGAIADYEGCLDINGEKPIWIYQELGKLLQQTHQFEKAVNIYQQAVEIEGTADLYQQLGNSHQKCQQIQEAIQAYKIAVTKPDFNPRSYCNLGDLELKLNHFEVAQAAYEKAVELKPRNPFFKLKLSQFFAKQGDIAQAIQHSLEALEIDPYYGSAINQLASLYEKIDDVEQAVSQLQELAQRQPDNSNIKVKLAKLLARQEKWDEAIIIYQEVLQLDNENIVAYLALADLLTSQGEIDAAITHLEQGISIKPEASQKPYDKLNRLLRRQGDLETVTNRYKTEAAQNPQHPGFQIKLGDVLAQQGELNAAVEHYQTAKELGLVQPWVFIRRKQALFEAGRLDDAEAELQQLVNQYPDKSTGLEQLAKLATQLYKFEQALDYWEQINQQFPQHIWCYAGRGNTLLELERVDEAKAQFQQLADQHPDKHHGFEGLAKVANHLQDWDTALDYWKVCVQQWPDKPSTQVGYGRMLMQLEQFTEAEIVFKSLQENFPDSHFGLEGLAKVARLSGQSELALEYSRQLSEQFPELDVGYVETVQNLIELGQFEAATQAFLAKPGSKNIERKRDKPKQFPADFILPKRVGVNNDYTFIEGKVQDFVASGKPYTLPVSIIIPVYNRASILAKTLAAITHQTYPKELIEVVVVDDGSSDAVHEVIRKYENHLELIYARQADRGYRLSEARNLGARAARHPYLITLDCDTLPSPELVELYMRFFHVTDQAILMGYRKYICTDLITDDQILQDINIALNLPEITTNNTVASRQSSAGKSYDWRLSLFTRTNYLKQCQWSFMGFVGANMAYPKNVVEKVGGYDEAFQHWGSEDNELGYRCYNAGYYFIPVMNAVGFHQEPPGGENETNREAGLAITRQQLEEKCPVPNYRKYEKGRVYEVPKVSIYIPAYNAEKYIKEAIDSALNQTYTDLEVCICDDGSTDGTLKVLAENYTNHPRVRWVSQANGGIGKASNTAVKMCRGMYIGQLDSDDILKPNAVELAAHYLDHHDIGCVYSNYEVIDGSGNFIRPGSHSLAFSREALLTGMVVNHFRMFRKRDWMRTTGFAEDIVNAVDYDMHLKLSEVCDFYHLPSSNYCYRFHGENTTIKQRKYQQNNHFVVINRALERMGLGDEWEAIQASIDKPTQVLIRRKNQQNQGDDETQELLIHYHKRIELQPNKPQVYLDLANFYWNIKDNEKALTVYHQALERNLENTSFTADIYKELAKVYWLKLGNLEQEDAADAKAIEKYTEILKANPLDGKAILGLVDIYHRRQEFETAIDYCKQYIEQLPENIWGYVRFGHVMTDSGNLTAAITAYQKVINLKPNAPFMVYQRVAKLLNGNVPAEEAITLYQNLVEKDIPIHLSAFLYKKLGESYQRNLEFKQAEKILKKAHDKYAETLTVNLPSQDREQLNSEFQNLKSLFLVPYRYEIRRQPNHVSLHIALGNAAMEQGCWDEATAAYRYALQLDPNQTQLYADLAGSLVQQRKWSEAITAYQQALKFKPDDKELQNELQETINHQEADDNSDLEGKFLRNQKWWEDDRVCLERMDTKPIKTELNDILCFVVVRNEMLRLPYFLNYYRNQGVSKFFIVDNDSTDETLDYLRQQPDVYIWHTDRSFGEADGGLWWMELLLQTYGINHWCLTLDGDEFLYYLDCETKNLHQLCAELDQQNKQALGAVLLDMYSQKPLRDVQYNPGQDPLEVCPYFDQKFYTTQKTDIDGKIAYYGGVRERVFPLRKRMNYLHKVPLIKYDYHTQLHHGQHSIENLELSAQSGCLLHFKYFQTFYDTAKEESARGEYALNSLKYKKFAEVIAKNPDITLFDPELSVKFEGSQQLLEFGIIRR